MAAEILLEVRLRYQPGPASMRPRRMAAEIGPRTTPGGGVDRLQ